MSTSLKTPVPAHRPSRGSRRAPSEPRRPAVRAAGNGGRVPRSTSSGGRTRRSNMTPLGALARGLFAGALGTAAMDALLFARYKRGGGESAFAPWEFSSGLDSWEEAPAPAQVGKRLVEGLFRRELPPQHAALVNNVTHWMFGILGGAQYGLLAGSLTSPRVRYGLPFGASVWAAGYVVLPAAKLYEPIWKYDRATLAKDLSAHLVYGLSTATALQLASGSIGGTA